MAITKTIQATVKNRTDTAANWTQKNPVLAEGEIIVVQTSAGETRLKIGDGVKTFTQLPYTDEQIYNNVVTSVNGQTGDVKLTNESKSLGLTSAAVGQIPKIKAVDSNGVPTEWEPVTLSSDMFYVLDIVEIKGDTATINNNFDDVVAANNQGKIFVFDGVCFWVSHTASETDGTLIEIEFTTIAEGYVTSLTWNRGNSTAIITKQIFPAFGQEALSAPGAVYYDKDTEKFIIKNISSTSGSSSDYVINVTLDTIQSSIGNWVLGYSCTCDKTYAEVLAAYQSGAKVIAHAIRNKEITLSDGSKKTIPIINEAPLTRYIAAQNLLVFDYVHNATDLSVSSGGLTYTTGDSGDSMICYVATYQFAFGAADTSADSVQIPTTTKVQDMIDTSISSINTNTYTIQVSNTAPAAGTSDKIITYVVEGATAG